MKYVVTLSAFLCLMIWHASGLAQAAPELHRYRIAVDAYLIKKRPAYSSVVDVISFGPAYQASLVYFGRSGTFDVGQRNNANAAAANSQAYPEGIVSLLGAHSNDVIINGGFSASGPGIPAGLLIIGGSVISPLSFQHALRLPEYQLSAIVCFDSHGKVTFMPTEQAHRYSFAAVKPCFSALQAGPVIVDHGANGISRAELWKTPYRRTVIGLDRTGGLYTVVFESPVNLYAVGEFLRAPQTTGNTFFVGGTGLSSGTGLGLYEAVNLDGDQNSIGILKGKVLTGDIYRKIPSAVVVQ